MTVETQAKTNRMCDAAYEHISGVRDDMGFAEALRVFQAQVAAFTMLAGEEYHSTLIGTGCAMALTQEVCMAIAERAVS